MASYSVQYTRPTIIIDPGGSPVNGFLVRVVLYPWGEARDLELTTDDPQAVHDAATMAIKNRAALERMSQVEVEIEE